MIIRTYELRTYTLVSDEAVVAYSDLYYPQHGPSLQRLFGVTVHGYWTAPAKVAHEFHVLLSYPEGADPDVIRQQYREHPECAANMPGFDPSVIQSVSITMLTPAASSPMQ